jgi:hypothetical protein
VVNSGQIIHINYYYHKRLMIKGYRPLYMVVIDGLIDG